MNRTGKRPCRFRKESRNDFPVKNRWDAAARPQKKKRKMPERQRRIIMAKKKKEQAQVLAQRQLAPAFMTAC